MAVEVEPALAMSTFLTCVTSVTARVHYVSLCVLGIIHFLQVLRSPLSSLAAIETNGWKPKGAYREVRMPSKCFKGDVDGSFDSEQSECE